MRTNRGHSRMVCLCVARVVAVAAVCLAMTAGPASALTINLTFDSGASDSPTFDPNALLLAPIIRQAADYWEDIIQDTWTLDIHYYYDDLSDANGTLADHLNEGTNLGKPTDARIRFDTQRYSVVRDWWFDPTPTNHSEFNMTQTLYRDLTAQQQSDWYGGSPPGVLEAGYRGAAVGGGVADGHFDIYSTAIHELGHAVGLTGAVSSGEYADGDYDVPTNLVYGATMDIKGDFHLDSGEALMCAGCGAESLRRMPTATDVFAAATGSGWTNIDLPRQDFWGGSNWNTAFSWEGNAVPGAFDEAYIRLQSGNPTVSLSGNGYCASLFVGEGDNVQTASHKLTVGGTATVDGLDSDLMVSTGGELEAAAVQIQNHAEVFMTGGLVDTNSMTINSGTWLTASGLGNTGTVDVQNVLVNNGIIRATGGATLVLTSSGGAVWDLDGSGNGVVEAITGNVTFASGSISDAFDGVMTIGAGHVLTIAQPWSLGGVGGLIDLNGGATTTERARIAGGLITASAGTILASGMAHIDSPITLSGAAVSVAGASDVLELNGATTFAGGSYTGLGTLKQDGNATVTGNTTISVATYDWDGGGASTTTINAAKTFTLNVANVDAGGTDQFDGTINNSGTLIVNVADNLWAMDGTLNMTGGTLSGDQVYVTGAVNAISGISTISANMNLRGGSATAVSSGATLRASGTTVIEAGSGANVAGRLELNGATRWQSPGTMTGSGTLYQGGSSTVEADTVIDVDTYDWDGSSSSVTQINSGVSLTIYSSKIDAGTATSDGFDGTLNMASGSGLNVYTTDPWRLDGTLNMNYAGAIARVSGSEMHVYGNVAASGNGESDINSDVVFQSIAGVTVATGAALELNGQTTFNGGSYTGAGTIRQDGPATVEAATTIDVDTYDMDGSNGYTTLTLNEALTLNVSKLDGVGSVFNGILNINNPGELTVNGSGAWTMAGTMNLDQNGHANKYMVKGDDMTISGYVNVTGATALSAKVHLTGVIDLGSSGDLIQLGGVANTIAGGSIDGLGTLVQAGGNLSGNGMIGANVNFIGVTNLLAKGGTLDVSGTIIDVATIGTSDASGVLNMANAWNTSVADRLQLSGGRVTGAAITNGGVTKGYGMIATGGFTNVSGGHVWVSGDALTLNTVNTTLAGYSTHTLDGDLHLKGSTVIQSNSSFSGSGDIIVDAGAALAIRNGAVVGVGIVNNGTMGVGLSPGSATAAGFAQGAGAKLTIELAGLGGVAGTDFDRLNVTGAANLGGTLDLAYYGGFSASRGDSFVILDAYSLTGAFGAVNFPDMQFWFIHYDTPTANVLVGIATPGDADLDGDVDLDDFGILKSNFGSGTTWGQGDFDNDGNVDLDDFGILKTNFGTAAGMSEQIPEPASLLLLLLATPLLVRRIKLNPDIS